MPDKQPIAAQERIESRVFHVRGQRVMLGMHLAETYGIEPQMLNQTVERNFECFPQGAVFQLNHEEMAGLKSPEALPGQSAPYAFTRQGVIMLSTILLDESTKNNNPDACAPTCSCRG